MVHEANQNTQGGFGITMYSFSLQSANLTLAHMAMLKSNKISVPVTHLPAQLLGSKTVSDIPMVNP